MGAAPTNSNDPKDCYFYLAAYLPRGVLRLPLRKRRMRKRRNEGEDVMNPGEEIDTLKKVLGELRRNGQILIAILYGSYAKGISHVRSDLDLALYPKAKDSREEIEI